MRLNTCGECMTNANVIQQMLNKRRVKPKHTHSNVIKNQNEKKLQPKFESQIDQQCACVFVFTSKPLMCDGGAKNFNVNYSVDICIPNWNETIYVCVCESKTRKIKMWYEFYILYWDVSRWNIYVQNKRDSYHVCATFFCFCYFSWQFLAHVQIHFTRNSRNNYLFFFFCLKWIKLKSCLFLEWHANEILCYDQFKISINRKKHFLYLNICCNGHGCVRTFWIFH